MKSRLTFLSIILFTVSSFCLVFALNFNFELPTSFFERFNSVSFNTPGNNFVGSIFLTDTSNQNQTINFNSDSIYCTKLQKGYYYNSQRGDRIRPLDNGTLNLLKTMDSSYRGLSISGGFYTLCSGDDYGFYGQITYNRSGTYSYLIAGTELDYRKNSYRTGGGLAESFQKFNGVTPIGYIRDSVGGIGFIGGLLSGSENLIELINSGSISDTGNSINDLFLLTGDQIVSANTGEYIFVTEGSGGSTENSLLGGLCIEGMASISCSNGIQANLSQNVYINSSNFISIKDVLNSVRKEYLTNCSSYKSLNLPSSLPSSNNKYLCYIYPTYSSNQVLTINLMTDSDKYKNKKIIVKNGDVKIINSMTPSSSSLNLFIDNGNLILSNNVENMQSFDASGYVSSYNGVSSGVLIKGNIYVNGLILGESGGYIMGYNHKLFFAGKVASLNTPCDDQDRIKQVENIFGNSDYSYYVNLQNVFMRACNTNGFGTDGTLCGQLGDNYAFCSIVIKK